MSGTYAIASPDFVVTDGATKTLWLHDLPSDPRNWRTEAMVASGDYCETLAVALEQIACALPATCVEQYQLQDAIGQLLYIQHRYKFTKK